MAVFTLMLPLHISRLKQYTFMRRTLLPNEYQIELLRVITSSGGCCENKF